MLSTPQAVPRAHRPRRVLVHARVTAAGVALGVASNSFRTVEAAALPRYFGTGSIGEIRGVVHAITVAASATGPLLLALGHDTTDSYRPLLLVAVLGQEGR